MHSYCSYCYITILIIVNYFTFFYLANDTIVYLNIIEVSSDPTVPLDFDVPLLVSPIDLFEEQWDLTTRQVCYKLLFHILKNVHLLNVITNNVVYRLFHLLTELIILVKSLNLLNWIWKWSPLAFKIWCNYNIFSLLNIILIKKILIY